jgi:hypothetical protein
VSQFAIRLSISSDRKRVSGSVAQVAPGPLSAGSKIDEQFPKLLRVKS